MIELLSLFVCLLVFVSNCNFYSNVAIVLPDNIHAYVIPGASLEFSIGTVATDAQLQ